MRLTLASTLAACLLLSGCATTGDQGDGRELASSAPLGWLVGCWQTEDGTSVERWSAEANTHLFGSNVSLSDGAVVFFEQMRIEPGASGPVLHAYPRGVGPSSFPMLAMEQNSITFANREHDYPQKIAYVLEDDVLKATISLIDDSQPTHWVFRPCSLAGQTIGLRPTGG